MGAVRASSLMKLDVERPVGGDELLLHTNGE